MLQRVNLLQVNAQHAGITVIATTITTIPITDITIAVIAVIAVVTTIAVEGKVGEGARAGCR